MEYFYSIFYVISTVTHFKFVLLLTAAPIIYALLSKTVIALVLTSTRHIEHVPESSEYARAAADLL